MPVKDVITWTEVIAATYMAFGLVDQEVEMFDRMWEKTCIVYNDASNWPLYENSPVMWTTMICGFARNGQSVESFSLFCLGHSAGTMAVDEVLTATVLGVCGALGSHVMGEQIHCLAQNSGFLSYTVVVNAIMSMYCKCGSMKVATKVFKSMPTHDLVSWNGLMAGHILHRHGDETLAAWERMKRAGVQSDSITFLLVLSAYRYTNLNLVDHCREVFCSMKTTYNTEPTSEHYATFVSVLGYWDLLEEAEEIISMMPFKPEPSVWRALLIVVEFVINQPLEKGMQSKYLLWSHKIHLPTYLYKISFLHQGDGIALKFLGER